MQSMFKKIVAAAAVVLALGAFSAGAGSAADQPKTEVVTASGCIGLNCH